jgi:hypothetical protein
MNTRRRFPLLVAALLATLAGDCLLPAAFAPDGPRPTYTPYGKLFLRRPTITPSKTITPGRPTAPSDAQHNATRTPLAAAPSTAELADLVVYYHVVAYHACPWDGPGMISLNIQNRGRADAGPFNVTINDQPARVEGIPAGEADNAVIPFEAGPVGMIRAVIDPDEAIAESDRDNNEFYILFTPPPPCTP